MNYAILNALKWELKDADFHSDLGKYFRLYVFQIYSQNKGISPALDINFEQLFIINSWYAHINLSIK